MLIRYSPGTYDDRIQFPVQKRIIAWERTGAHRELLVLEIASGRLHELKIDECVSLMSRQKRVRSWFKLVGLFLLLVGFCVGTNNIILRICSDGLRSGILVTVQLVMSLALLGYLAWVFKVTIERHIYGGLKHSLGEICFQSEKESSQFGDISSNERRKKDGSQA